MTTPRTTTTLAAFGKDHRATVVHPSAALTPKAGVPKLAYVPSYATDIRWRIAQHNLFSR